jgi:ABC-type uncharacterized transport system permease subunit
MVRNFLLILKMQNRQAWYHKKAAAGTLLSWSVRIGLNVALYTGIYNIMGKQTVHAISLPIAISSMMFYAIFFGFGARDVVRLINNEYKSGAMEIWLNKPVSYLSLKMGESFGKNVPVAAGLNLCAALYWIFFGLPEIDHTLLRFLSGLALLILGLMLMSLLYIVVGLSVIWINDNSPLFHIVDKTAMIFGGIYIPISFFPHAFRLTGELLPMGAAMYVSQIFYPDFFQHLPRFLLTQIIWLVLMIIIVHKTNQSAQQRLTVNGG